MAVAISTRVWQHSRQRGTKKLLLLALADFADANGLCWPGIPTLAEQINESDRHTIRLLDQLIDDGDIASKPGRGRGHKTIYAVLVGLTPPERDAVKGALQNTVIKSTFQEKVTSQDRNSDILGREIVTSGAERVTSGAKDEGSNRAAQQPKTTQNQNDIRMIRHEDPSWIRGEEQATKAAPLPTPVAPAPSAPDDQTSDAERLLIEAYPKLKLSSAQRGAIRQQVTDLTQWRAVIKLWTLNGYIPKVGNLLDRYQKEPAHEAHKSSRRPVVQEERPAGSGPPPGVTTPTAEEWKTWISPRNARAG